MGSSSEYGRWRWEASPDDGMATAFDINNPKNDYAYLHNEVLNGEAYNREAINREALNGEAFLNDD